MRRFKAGQLVKVARKAGEQVYGHIVDSFDGAVLAVRIAGQVVHVDAHSVVRPR